MLMIVIVISCHTAAIEDCFQWNNIEEDNLRDVLIKIDSKFFLWTQLMTRWNYTSILYLIFIINCLWLYKYYLCICYEIVVIRLSKLASESSRMGAGDEKRILLSAGVALCFHPSVIRAILCYAPCFLVAATNLNVWCLIFALSLFILHCFHCMNFLFSGFLFLFLFCLQITLTHFWKKERYACLKSCSIIIINGKIM